MPFSSSDSDTAERLRETARPAVLLVDDDSKNLLALESVLEGGDFTLVKAQTGDQALLALMNDEYAAIVLDVQMPDVNGIELARLIKQRKRTRHIPIIFLTAHYRENEDVVLGYDVGAVDYLTKPIHPAVLRSKVNVFVDLFRKTRALVQLNADMEVEISERRTAEERFRVVVEAAASAMIVFDVAGNIVLVNTQAEQSFGYMRDELLERKIGDLFPAGEMPSVVAPGSYGAAGAGGATILESGEFRARRKDGSSFPVEVNCRPIQSSEGTWSLASVLDVTERKRAEETLLAANAQLEAKNIALQREAEERKRRIRAEGAQAEAEAANAAKDRFLAMLSHELRTPLSPIVHAVTLLEEDDECPPFVRESIATIRRNVQLEARLIDDLLDLARIRSGKLRLHVGQVDAHEVLRYAIEICRPDITAHKVMVVESLKATTTRLRADPARLQQIFWNLLNNAVKFTPPGGTINVRTCDAEDGEAIVVEISDTGVGIDSEKIERIFDAFEQATRTTSAGLGLGLAISKALVDLHGGTIAARSEGPSLGATFSVILPCSFQIEVEEAAAPSEPDRVSGLKILLVEDHKDTADTLHRLLVRRGYEVRVAVCVAHALETAKEFPFDVLVTDIGLPDGRGTDLLQELRQLAGHPLRAIAMSGFGMEEDLERSRVAGFSDHLTKPVEFPMLQQAIVRVTQEMPELVAR